MEGGQEGVGLGGAWEERWRGGLGGSLDGGREEEGGDVSRMVEGLEPRPWREDASDVGVGLGWLHA